MELGMIHRGEHSEITTVVGDTIDSELSGNMIDVCPVGALTSKPFRYSARTWELSRRKSVSPHDSTGANLIVQVKSGKVMRVVPLENEDVNECWIADRDRFSYEAVNSELRLTTPMIKQGGDWKSVDWTTALSYVANGLTQIKADHGVASIGVLGSTHSTVEELHLLAKLVRGLGSDNIDHRLRHSDFSLSGQGVRWLGTSIASLSTLQRVLVVGSFLRKDHPLLAQRLRQAVAELLEEGRDEAGLFAPDVVVDAEQRVHLRIAQVEARDVNRRLRRHAADGGVVGRGRAFKAIDDPLQHARVLTKARPDELAVLVLPEPVDEEDLR
jgi:NADH-quinone oxidoreductase subunit G